MNDEILQKLQSLSAYRSALQQQIDQQGIPFELSSSIEYATLVEELSVAEEELEQQVEALKAAQTLISAERQRYQDLFEFAPDGYLVTSPDGVIQEANRAAAQQLGVTQSFLIGKPLIVFVAIDQRFTFRTALTSLLQSSDTRSWEIQFQPRDRPAFNAALTTRVVRDQDENAIALRWSIRDITAHKRAEMQIHLLNAGLVQRTLMERTSRLITENVRASLDEHQILQTALQELVLALDLLGCDVGLYNLQTKTSTIQYSHTIDGFAFLSKPGTVAMSDFSDGYAQLLQGQNFQFCETIPDSSHGQSSILACPIADHEGVLGEIWCFSPPNRFLEIHQVDLVQQVANQCAIALRQARLHAKAQAHIAQLDQLNRLKNDFISTLSHELRTPLTNMKMALHLLKVSRTDEQRDRCFSILEAECDRETDLVNDLLDLQQLEADNYPTFLLESIDIQELLSIIIAPWHPRIAKQQQVLTIDFPDELPLIVSDRATLRRLLLELIQNAHKHTPEGGQISLTVRHDPIAPYAIAFVVKNQAEIPATELPHIFEKFYRAQKAGSWDISGTGLGLALVKELVKQLQGDIQVLSESGWTTFTVHLPDRLVQHG